jgi:hypothetical protein
MIGCFIDFHLKIGIIWKYQIYFDTQNTIIIFD